uniref:UPF0020 domain-containing protein n=1 Tax=Ditylenchus dipsaci TaxID=166011 RepID=A0A915DU14_9BILA
MFDIPISTKSLLCLTRHIHLFEFDHIEDVMKILSRSMLLKSAFELLVEKGSEEDVVQHISDHPDLLKRFDVPSCSWALKLHAHGRKRDFDYITRILEKFANVINLMKAPIDLQNAVNQFTILEDNTEDPSQNIQFCRFIGEGRGSLKNEFDLKKRKYIGNSTMDPELSFIQANLVQSLPGSLILDPFVGTGGLLLSAARFGGLTMGTEINYKVARAVGKSSRASELMLCADQSIRANFVQYGLEERLVDIILADSSQHQLWHMGGMLDAIMTDPPYGVREKGRKLGNKPINCERSEAQKCEGQSRYPEKTKYGISSVYLDLINLAATLLRVGGRLAFWFPVFRNEYTEDVLPKHKCMHLLYNCEQILTKESARRLLVYTKERPCWSTEDKAYFDVDCYKESTFRDKVFNGC